MTAFSIADLRKARGTDFSEISNALKKTNEGFGAKEDDEFFKLERDKAGNGSAVIRFLPKHPEDELPWVSIYTHGFQGPTGRWYIENSLTTLGEADPVSEANRTLWASGLEKDKELARKQKRKLSYISNIRIISYPAHPEMEGKVMAFKYGKKIFEKVMDKANPTFADEKPVNPFDAFDGCDFKLRMRQVDGYPNYDTSVFADPAPIADTDEGILEVLNAMSPLKAYIAPSKFKSYDELTKKFHQVMNAQPASTQTAEDVADRLGKSVDSKPAGKVVKEKVNAPVKAEAPVDGESDESIEDYFRSIAN